LGFWTSKDGSPDAIEFGAGEVSLWRREADVDVHMFDLVGWSLAIGHLQNGCSDLVHQGC
jgi:hypothetical protein